MSEIVTSHSRALPLDQGINVAPIERLPFCMMSPVTRFILCRNIDTLDRSPYDVINNRWRWWYLVCMMGHTGLLHLLPYRTRRYKESKLWCQVCMPLQDESPHSTVEARPMLLVGLATNLQSGGRRPLLVELCQHLMLQTRRWLEITFYNQRVPCLVKALY